MFVQVWGALAPGKGESRDDCETEGCECAICEKLGKCTETLSTTPYMYTVKLRLRDTAWRPGETPGGASSLEKPVGVPVGAPSLVTSKEAPSHMVTAMETLETLESLESLW